MKNLDLSAPWMVMYRSIVALFDQDDEVDVEYFEGEDTPTVKIRVRNAAKADALTAIMPREKRFGNVVMNIQVIPENSDEEPTECKLFQAAFANNPIVSRIVTVGTPMGDTVDYMVFEKEVVQYFIDDISSLSGMRSCLYQDIAREVFDSAGIKFCTETE